jgi:hypothetical protein
VAHCIDATDLATSLERLRGRRGEHGSVATAAAAQLATLAHAQGGFDLIVFQFPLCGVTKDRAAFEAATVPPELRNRQLLWATMRACAKPAVLQPNGELWISAKKDNKYDMRHFLRAPLIEKDATTSARPCCSNEISTLLFARQWLFQPAHYPVRHRLGRCATMHLCAG